MIVISDLASGHGHVATGGMSKLCRIVVCDDLELLHRIHRQTRQLLRTRQADRVGSVTAVQDKRLVAGSATGYGEYRIVLRRSRSGINHDHAGRQRSEEHTSELQSHVNLVCRLLLEK